jgi:hypothetical protein
LCCSYPNDLLMQNKIQVSNVHTLKTIECHKNENLIGNSV